MIPEKKIVQNHLKFHNKYKNIPLLGGAVIPSFFKKNSNIWEILDGCLSWFTSIDTIYNKIVKKPYHLPTCNLSIKNNFLNKHKISFDENLKTGEDVDLCNKVREKNGKLMLIKMQEFHIKIGKLLVVFLIIQNGADINFILSIRRNILNYWEVLISILFLCFFILFLCHLLIFFQLFLLCFPDKI